MSLSEEDKMDLRKAAFEELIEEGNAKRLRGRPLRRFVLNRWTKRIDKIYAETERNRAKDKEV